MASTYVWDRLAENPKLLDDGGKAYVHGFGNLAQIDGAGNRQYMLNDALGSLRGLSDNSGGLVGSANYDAFGSVRGQSGVGSALGFTGELYSAQTGLLHLRARDYRPGLGRFLSADSVQPNAPGSQGYNLYAYVANNPTRWIDPSGHRSGTAEYAVANTPALFALAALASVGLASIDFTSPSAWEFPYNFATSALVFTILACYLNPVCGGIANGFRGTVKPIPVPPGQQPTPIPVPPGQPPTVIPIPPGAPPVVTPIPLERQPVPIPLLKPADRRPPVKDPAPDPKPPKDPPGLPFKPPCELLEPVYELLGLGGCDDEGENIFYPGGDTKETTRHIDYAINVEMQLEQLHAASKAHDRHWYNKDSRCINRKPGEACDEYPFAKAVEGGETNRPSLFLAPFSEQRKQGGEMEAFYRACQIPKNDSYSQDNTYLVVPSYDRNTGYECANGRTK